MSKYLLDSDVIIWFLRGKEETKELLDELKSSGIPSCCALSITEIVVGERQKEKPATRQFLNSLNVIPLNYTEAALTGELIKEYKAKGKTLSFIDAAIAATCLIHKLILVTYNHKDYPMPDLKKLKMSSHG